MSAKILTLHLMLAPTTDPGDLITDLNASVLCALEEDKKSILAWKWEENG